jgi:hypothetical protein
MNSLSVEHIDPRNGVLVSGLENEFNEIIADLSYNSRKVNRFVPYRVCEYPAPANEGDVGEFLIGGEWAVCEFMVEGGVWWRESNRIGNCQVEGGLTSLKTGRLREMSKEASLLGAEATARTMSAPVVCLETKIKYQSGMEASRATGVSRKGISWCCHGKQKTAGGLHWQFAS